MSFLTLSNSPGITQRTNVWAMRQMLMFQWPHIVLNLFGAPKPLPKNKSAFISFRRPVPFTAADTPLQEGVTPSATQFRYETVTNQLRQYGFLVNLTDVTEDLHEDPVFNDALEQAGLNLGRTIEQITYGVVRAGTNVIFANGSARNAVNSPISLPKLRQAARALKSQKAMKMTSILEPGIEKIGTRPVEACWPVVVHTDCEADVRDLPGFAPTSEYGTRTLISEHEFGRVEEFRFVSTADLEPFRNAGGTAGSSVLSTGGTNADVYPYLVFGREAFGMTPLADKTALQPIIRRPGVSDSGDPLGQRGWVGWKTYFCATILNQAWMVRIECAASSL